MEKSIAWLHLIATIMVTLLCAAASVVLFAHLHASWAPASAVVASTQVAAALVVVVLPGLVAESDERALCVGVAGAPLLLILATFGAAALSGQVSGIALVQFFEFGIGLTGLAYGAQCTHAWSHRGKHL